MYNRTEKLESAVLTVKSRAGYVYDNALIDHYCKRHTDFHMKQLLESISDMKDAIARFEEALAEAKSEKDAA